MRMSYAPELRKWALFGAGLLVEILLRLILLVDLLVDLKGSERHHEAVPRAGRELFGRPLAVATGGCGLCDPGALPRRRPVHMAGGSLALLATALDVRRWGAPGAVAARLSHAFGRRCEAKGALRCFMAIYRMIPEKVKQ